MRYYLYAAQSRELQLAYAYARHSSRKVPGTHTEVEVEPQNIHAAAIHAVAAPSYTLLPSCSSQTDHRAVTAW